MRRANEPDQLQRSQQVQPTAPNKPLQRGKNTLHTGPSQMAQTEMTANDTQSQTSSTEAKRNDGLTPTPNFFHMSGKKNIEGKLPLMNYLFSD